MKLKIGLISFLLALTSGVAAGNDLSLGDMMNLPSSLATGREVARREAAGIMTIITREEIVRSGARDLMEVLGLFVPGVSFAVDVESITGIGMRGLTAQEGRVLLLIDGIPQNEEVYSTLQLGNHYPAEIIERIDVIRGPGSIYHGQYAQIGVISVTTRHSVQNGQTAAVRYARMQEADSHRDFTAAFGSHVGGGRVSALVSSAYGNPSDRDYIDSNLVPTNLANENQRTNFMANANASFGGLDLRFLYDRLRSDSFHAAAVLPTSGVAERATFEQKSFKAAYTIEASPKLKITPKYLYRFAQPYYMHAPEIPDSFTYFTRRHEVGAVADIAVTGSSALMAGYTYSHLRIEAEAPENLSNFPGGHTDESNSVFAESTTGFSFGNLVVGARYEIPKNYDPAFVPRIGLTKAYDRWHYKLMAAQSYRMPQGIQADLTGAPERGLKPETATNYEAEAGYMISDQVFLVGNLFDTHIKNPLVWTPESGNPEGIYSNQGEIGTQGAEAELRYVPSSKFEVNTNLSFYRRAHANDSIYVVPDHDDQYLAFSKVRGNLVMGYKPTANFGIFPSVSYFGTRYGYIPSDGGAGSADVVKEYDPMFVTNLNMRWTDLGLRGVEFTAGIMNLFDAKIDYSQSYNKGYNYPPVPGHSRAYNFMLAYSREY